MKLPKRNTGYKYSIKDNHGTTASQVICYDYNIDGFDWILMADVETNPAHRGKGLATDLINKAYKDASKKIKGCIYLLRIVTKMRSIFIRNLILKPLNPTGLMMEITT